MFTKRMSKYIFSNYCIYKQLSRFNKDLPFYIPYKYFSLCSNFNARMNQELENNHAYSIMEAAGYAISLNKNPNKEQKLTSKSFELLINEDWSRRSPSGIFGIFPKFGTYCSENNLCISNKMFDSFIDNLTDNIKFASDEELENLFIALKKWPETGTVRTRNFIEVWAALDDECLNRYKDWSFDKMLQFVARFYSLGITRISDYCIKCARKLTSKAQKLSLQQVVQTYFLIGLLRKSPLDMHNLEVYVDEHFSEFTIDELAVISMGCFKSKTPIRNMNLVKKFINKVIEHLKDVTDISLVAHLKIIRYSMKIADDDSIYLFLDALQSELGRFNVTTNVHVALLGTATLTLHKQCLNTIAHNTINSIEKARVKDLERFVLTFGTFNFRPETSECFFEKVIKELRKPEREMEIHQHSRSFACCVSFLGLLGIYPEDLIAKVLQPGFLKETYGKYFLNYGREILTLHNVSEIFSLDPSIPRLKPQQVLLLSQKYTDYMPSEDYVKEYNITERLCLDIMKQLKKQRGGSDYVAGDHILNHHQRGDIIVCNDHNGNPVPVADTLKKIKFGAIKRLPDRENNWIALIVAGRNALISGYNVPSGQFYTKLRELRKLGYKSSLILWSTYSKLQTDEEKIIYLNDVIKEAISNK